MQNWGVIEAWEYEPERFYFHGFEYKRPPYEYTPDFVVKYSATPDGKSILLLRDIGFISAFPDRLTYVEVKGQETGRDRSKWRRFAKHVGYPLDIIKQDEMYKLQTAFKPLIPMWESRIRYQA